MSCSGQKGACSSGNLWISTDGAPSGIGYNDGLFKVALKSPDRGKVEQFLSVPRDAETWGPVIRDDEGMAFVSVQHPGEDGVWGPHLAVPLRRHLGPRPSVVQVYRGKKGHGHRE